MLRELFKNAVVAKSDTTRTSIVNKILSAEDKKASLEAIEALIPLLLAHPSPHLADNSLEAPRAKLENFRLHVRPLDLSSEGIFKFFLPISSEEFESLPLAPISGRNQKNLEMIRNTNLRRISPEKEEIRLLSFTGWKYLQSYAPRSDGGYCYRDEWRCTDGWIRRGPDFPHFKATIWTAVEASEQQPLRAEAATILEIMAERHKVDELRAHTIIPVMLISFVGPRHARILLAHFDGDKLCIEMWWAGKVNPDVATNMPFEYGDGVEDLPTSTSASE
ncbi:hypothetical protein BJX66DRAFT_343552 [Aspergillus keveii]|uniref:Ankyrin repeat protein n=1 Tax=Aspergillus keveii TaxID=714993 RepID=A0ABR4FNW2_9EURO